MSIFSQQKSVGKEGCFPSVFLERIRTVRILLSAVFLFGAVAAQAQSAAAGEAVVVSLRAIVESGGTATQAQLVSRYGAEAGASFALAKQIFNASKGRSLNLSSSDWDAIAHAAKDLSASRAAGAIASVISQNKALSRANIVAAFAVPAARTAGPAVASQVAAANSASAFQAIACPAGAVQCTALVNDLEKAKAGQHQGMTVSEASQVAAIYGQISSEIDANAANCGADQATCVADLKNGFAGVVRAFGTRTNVQFAKDVITSGSETSDFSSFRGKNAPIARGVKNAGELGRGMGSALEQCFTGGKA
jgi:hypothetical protein